MKALQWESDNNSSSKDGLEDGEDDFKELAQELNKEEGLGEPVQQTLANILATSDCNWTRTQNHLVLKRTLNHLAKLALNDRAVF